MRRFTAIAATIAAFCLAQDAKAGDPPNLLIAVDDMNDWTGCLGGHPDARTPNIDRLAGRGTLFANAHTAAPVCNPSRTAILSGLGPYSTGVYHNADGWARSEALRGIASLPQHFHDHGYTTEMVGKIFQSAPANLAQALDRNGGRMGGQNFSLRADDFPDPFKGMKGRHNFAVHWGGLDAKKAAELSDPKIADWAVARLAEQRDKPFLLMVGFHRPHTPLISPRKFYEMFDRDKVAMPPLKPDDLEDMPWMARQVATAGFQEIEGGHYKQFAGGGYQPDIVRAYLAACTFVDAQIGRVLDALDRSPYPENTIVVLFSDHGWALGEHYHFKKWALWDDTTHVPLVIHAPGLSQKKNRCDASVSLLDIYPTLVDLCGLPATAHKLDGRSLRPLLADPASAWERPALTTYGPSNHALRSRRWRYVRWADGSEELYDHEADPNEWNNIAGATDRSAVKAELVRWLPTRNLPAAVSDHRSPVTLTRAKDMLSFDAVQPTFKGKPITVRAKIGPKLSDGVILSHGGNFCGYALFVKDGHLAMSVMDVPEPLRWDTLTPSRTVVTAEEKLPARKCEVEGRLLADGHVALSIDGKEVGRGRAKTLSIHPAGRMQLGEAPGVYVPTGPFSPPFKFTGDIEQVVVFFGDDVPSEE